MLDINDVLDAQNSENTVPISSSDNTISKNFPNYNNMIKNKIKTINSIYENIDNYVKEQKNIDQPQSIASSYSGYLSTNAVNYALTWANSYNPNYVNYGDTNEDCTNYVSQCVYAGSVPATSYWYSGSYAWINVIGFYNYMKSNGYTSGGDSQDDARLGDVVQLYNSSTQKWAHSIILTAQDPMGWRYCGHSNFRYNWPLRDVYPSSTYTQARYIKFWH